MRVRNASREVTVSLASVVFGMCGRVETCFFPRRGPKGKLLDPFLFKAFSVLAESWCLLLSSNCWGLSA